MGHSSNELFYRLSVKNHQEKSSSPSCVTSTRLHKGNQRNLVAFFTPGQAIGADRSGNWRSQSEVLVSFKIKKGGRISPTADNDILFSLFYWEIELFLGIFQSSQIMEICVAHCF